MEIQNNSENNVTFAKIKLRTILKIKTVLTVFDGKYLFEKYGIKPVWVVNHNKITDTYDTRAIVKTSMKPNVKVFDTDGDIYVPGEWEKTIDELYYSALAVKSACKANDKNFNDADEYARENFDDIEYALEHAPRCENYLYQGFWFCYSEVEDGFKAVIVGDRLIICKDKVEAFSKGGYDHYIITIYDLLNGCEQCLRGITVDTIFNRLSPEIYKPGKGPDGWEEYLKNYVKELKEKESTLESSEHGSKTNKISGK